MPTNVLSKKVRTRQLITMAAGGMIGAGWMVMIGFWLLTAGPLQAVLAFLCGLLMVLPVALCYCRLAARFPQSGGEIVYVYEAFGMRASFFVGWLYLWICLGWSAFQIVVAAWFINLLLPGIANTVLYTVLGHDVSSGFLIVAALGTLAVTWINYRGGGVSAQVLECLTLVMVIGIVGIIVFCFVGGSATNLTLWNDSATASGGFLALLITVPVWYSGFNAMAQALGEVRELQVRHISRVIVGTLIGTALFYVAVIVAVGYGSTPDKLAIASPALLGVFDAESAQGQYTVLLLGLLGIATTWIILFFAGTRILFALSRACVIPGLFSRVHAKYGAPHVAVLTVGLCTLAGSLSGRGILELVVNTSGICFALIYLAVAMTYLRLAKQPGESTLPGPLNNNPSAELLIGRIAVVSATCMVLLAVLVTFRSNAQSSAQLLPLEWVVLILWMALAALMWRFGRPLRASISEAQRRERIHTR